MADRTLKLTATFNDAGALTGLRVLNQEIGKTSDAGKQGKTGLLGFGKGLTEMQGKMVEFTAAAALVGAGIKKTYDAAKEGAQLELASQRFDNLTASIGSTSDAMLTKLSAGTAGMMSNADMIASASQIISLGLADNEDDVVSLATLVSQLGWDMNQVIMTFANNSKMRLDALGLSVTDVEQRAAALERQGYNTDKAFDLAVIQAGQAKLALLGSAADTDVGSMARAEAAIKNLSDSLKTRLVPTFGDAADAVYYFLEGHNLLIDSLASHTSQVEASAMDWNTYAEEAIRAAEASGLISAAIAEQARQEATASGTLFVLTNALRGQGIEIDYVDQKTWELNRTTQALVDQAMRLNDEGGKLADGFQKQASAAEKAEIAEANLRKEQERVKLAMSELQTMMDGPLGKEYDSFTQKNADLQAQVAEVQQTIQDLGGTEYMSPEQAQQITTLQSELNNVATQIVALDEQIKSGELNNNKKYAAEQNLEDLRQSAWELEQQIKEMGGKPYVTSKNLEDIDEAKAKLAELNAAIATNAAEHRTATREILLDLAMQAAARDGITTTEEYNVIANLAYQWGLVDETTRDAMISTNQFFDDLNSGAATSEETVNKMVNQEAALAAQTSLANAAFGENGVGALNDYKTKMLELVEPMTTNAELITTTADAAGILNDKLNAVSGTYDIRFNITQNGSIPNVSGYNSGQGPTGQTTQGQNSTTAAELENGGASGIENFVVPPGFPNDTYRVGMTSGEVFSIRTPAQQLRQAFGGVGDKGGGVQIGNLNIYQMPGEDAEALAQRVVKIIQEHNR